MSYQFQPIGEVEKLDEVPETANAIVEVDGEIKRVPGSGLGGATERFDAIFTATYGSLPKAALTYTVTCNKSFEEVSKLMEETGWVSVLLMLPDEHASMTNLACLAYDEPMPTATEGTKASGQPDRYKFIFSESMVVYYATGDITYGG